MTVSGAHLNPSITLGLAARGRIAWTEVPGYALAQLLGAFAGVSLVALALGTEGHLGSTLPSVDLVVVGILEAAFTAALMGSVFLLADHGLGRFRWRILLPPSVVGLSTFLTGPLTGSSLNPARSIAPAALSGSYAGLEVDLVSVPAGALLISLLLRPRSCRCGRWSAILPRMAGTERGRTLGVRAFLGLKPR